MMMYMYVIIAELSAERCILHKIFGQILGNLSTNLYCQSKEVDIYLLILYEIWCKMNL